MVKSKALLNRSTALVSAFALAFAATLPALLNGNAHALIQSRSITVSSSKAGETNVDYTVRFKGDGGDKTIKGIVIDFCQESPIIGPGTCTVPTGFNLNIGASSDVNAYQNMTGWTAVEGNSGRTLALTKAAGETITTTGTPTYGFTITGVTNPDLGNHTYYARIILYANDTGADSPDPTPASGGYLSTDPPTVGNTLDAGGIALSTSNQLTITSKVQERLQFCLYTDGTCSDSIAQPTGYEKDSVDPYRTNAITLGDNNGVLDINQPFVSNTTKFDISTNASQGAVVVMKGDTLKTGLFNVAAIGSAAAPSAPGTEQFGMCLWQSAGSGFDISATGTGNANNTYNNANCNSTSDSAGEVSTGTPAVGNNFGGAGSAQFGFNTTNTLSSSGDTLGKKAAGTASTATLAFIGNVAPTTEAGIYTTTLTFIATGTY